MILNPSVTGLDFSYSKNDDAKFGLGAQVGTFLADGFALMVNAGADWSQPKDTYTLGTGVRCYFNTTGIYIGGGLDWERIRLKGGEHNNDWGVGIEAGYAYFLSRTVTIEPAVYYKWRFDDSDNSRFGIKVGFGFYFLKIIFVTYHRMCESIAHRCFNHDSEYEGRHESNFLLSYCFHKA